jgi:hypothetical protein
MKKIMAAILAGVLARGLFVPFACAEDSTCRRDLEVLLDRQRSAFDNMDRKEAVAIAAPDADEAAAIAAPDATLRYADGTTVSIDEWREIIRKSFKEMETMKSQHKILELEVEGSRAVVTYVETHAYTLKTDSPLKYTSISRWRTMLAKTPQGWRMKNYMQLSEETTRDGKPLTPDVSRPRW